MLYIVVGSDNIGAEGAKMVEDLPLESLVSLELGTLPSYCTFLLASNRRVGNNNSAEHGANAVARILLKSSELLTLSLSTDHPLWPS